MKSDRNTSLILMHSNPELSCPIKLSEIHGKQCKKIITATKDECQKLAQRFGLIKVEKFTADIDISILPSFSVVSVEGKFSAVVVQECVISLQKFSANIMGSYNCKYSSDNDTTCHENLDIDVMAEDPPEPIVDGKFDIGIILTEQFGLELNPFPRNPEINSDTLSNLITSKKYKQTRNNPFFILKKLK